MSQRTYFTHPRQPDQWVITTCSRERARLKRRGWRKVLVRDIPRPIYAALRDDVWTGTFAVVRIYPDTARRNQTVYRLSRLPDASVA